MFPCSVEEARALYPDAERIEGTMILREVDEPPTARIALFGKGRTKESHP